MAFFKLRKAGGEPAAPAPAPESVDALRKRARYRLAGAAILVLAGVVGFPLLFDNQPRPIAVDIPIDIPDKAKVKPLAVVPVTPASESKALATSATPEPVVAVPAVVASRATAGSLETGVNKPVESKAQTKDAQKEEVIISSSKSAAKSTPAKSEEKGAAKAEAKVEAKPEAKPVDKKADKPAEATGRFVVQFGAFTDSAHAHEARVTVEKAGLKTYAQIAETPDGKKFRVRVGPFEKRSDAEKAAEKIKKIGLPATILGL
jgi:DedD protein